MACKGQQHRYKSPSSYNIKKPQVFTLPSELAEISGIAYYHQDHNIFCESDEHGNVYKIMMNKHRDIKRWKFGKPQDYEDIMLLNEVVYVLKSSGDVVAVTFSQDSVGSVKYDFPEKGAFEFESLYYEPGSDNLVLLCKDCGVDDKRQTVSAYAFDYKTGNFSGAYTMDASKAIAITGSNKSGKFKPSAAAIHPLNKKLYIISSVNKALLIADRKGIIEEVYQLDPGIFHHPEGITFDETGGMYISNEAEDPKPANILFYEYKKNAQQ